MNSERFVIETPENISFGYDIAGIGSRFLAVFIDSLIQGVLYALLLLAFAFVSATGRVLDVPRQLSELLGVILLIVVFLVQFGYFLFFELVTGGQSPGKRLFGLRVVKENGYPLSPLDSVIRNILRIVDFFPFGYGVGLIVMFLNDRSKRLGDFAAGTLVVKVREQIKLGELQKPVIAAPAQIPDLPGLENLREADIQMIESYFRRRVELKNTDTLAPRLAQRIRERMNKREPETFQDASSAEEFMRTVAAAYRRGRAS